MAEIDKELPNTKRSEVKVPGAEEIQTTVAEEQISERSPVEVTPEEDGGATINFEPGAINVPGTENHFDNLADLLPDEITSPIGSRLKENYVDYKNSRKEWERTYIEGLDLLGFKYELRNEPFQGA